MWFSPNIGLRMSVADTGSCSQGQYAGMDNGYLPLGMGPIPVAPCPKGAPFPTPMPGGRPSSATTYK